MLDYARRTRSQNVIGNSFGLTFGRVICTADSDPSGRPDAPLHQLSCLIANSRICSAKCGGL
jgi:hypothetical protein